MQASVALDRWLLGSSGWIKERGYPERLVPSANVARVNHDSTRRAAVALFGGRVRVAERSL